MIQRFIAAHWKTLLLILGIALSLLNTFVVYACIVVGARTERQMETEREQYCQDHPEALEKGSLTDE